MRRARDRADRRADRRPPAGRALDRRRGARRRRPGRRRAAVGTRPGSSLLLSTDHDPLTLARLAGNVSRDTVTDLAVSSPAPAGPGRLVDRRARPADPDGHHAAGARRRRDRPRDRCHRRAGRAPPHARPPGGDRRLGPHAARRDRDRAGGADADRRLPGVRARRRHRGDVLSPVLRRRGHRRAVGTRGPPAWPSRSWPPPPSPPSRCRWWRGPADPTSCGPSSRARHHVSPRRVRRGRLRLALLVLAVGARDRRVRRARRQERDARRRAADPARRPGRSSLAPAPTRPRRSHRCPTCRPARSPCTTRRRATSSPAGASTRRCRSRASRS